MSKRLCRKPVKSVVKYSGYCFLICYEHDIYILGIDKKRI